MARRAKGEGSVFKDKQGYWNSQIIIGYENGKPKYKKFRSKNKERSLNVSMPINSQWELIRPRLSQKLLSKCFLMPI